MPPIRKHVYGPRGDRNDETTPHKLEYMREWRNRNRDKVRAYNKKSYDNRKWFWRKTPCTEEQYQAAMLAQGGLCAICRRPETVVVRGKVRPLHIDHDHVREHFRGLLCSACNTGLGKFSDDPTRLEAAARYLRASVEPALLRGIGEDGASPRTKATGLRSRK